jgi:hypothetical protein
MNMTSATAIQRQTVSLAAAVKDFGQHFKSLTADSKAQKQDQRPKSVSAVVYSSHGL